MDYSLDSPEWKLLKQTADRICALEAKVGLAALPDEERVFFLVWIADGEVGNGGMHAVCYNSTGDYLAKLAWAFKAIGAADKAATFDGLSRAFGPVGPSANHAERVLQHEALSDEAATDIDILDDEYFASTESIDALLYKWCEPWARMRLGT